MKKRILLAICGVLLCILLFPGGASCREVLDQAGRRLIVPDTPQRVVALAPSLAEIVYSLGAEGVLKGATQFSNYPPEAELLPRVGSYVRLDIEKIVAMEPDLCLAIRDGNPKHLVEQIEALGIPVYVIDPRDIRGIMQAIEGIGDVLGVSFKARILTAAMELRVARIKEKMSLSRTQPKVFFQVDAAPIITAGSNTFTHELITLAGGTNLGAGSVPYPRFSWEQVLLLQPDIVIVTSMAGGHAPEQLKQEWRRWPQLPAVKNNNIHVVDADLFDRPTARLIDGLEALARIIHPELFEAGNGR